jgi:hypothetical protein
MEGKKRMLPIPLSTRVIVHLRDDGSKFAQTEEKGTQGFDSDEDPREKDQETMTAPQQNVMTKAACTCSMQAHQTHDDYIQ